MAVQLSCTVIVLLVYWLWSDFIAHLQLYFVLYLLTTFNCLFFHYSFIFTSGYIREPYAISPLSIISNLLFYFTIFHSHGSYIPLICKISLIPFSLVFYSPFFHHFPIKTHIPSTNIRNQLPHSSQILFLHLKIFIIIFASLKLSFIIVLVSTIVPTMFLTSVFHG